MNAQQKSATAKSTAKQRTAKRTPKPPPSPEPAQKPRRGAKPQASPKLSALQAAAKVLQEAGTSMTTGQMIEQMAAKGYWSSPGGQTPAATLYSAILRHIAKQGKDSRFTKIERGKFLYQG